MSKPQSYMDGGWGWVVVFAAFFNLFILIGMVKSFGIVFVEMVDVYNAPSSAVAVLFSLATACSMFCAPFATALADVYTCRVVSMVGGLMVCAGLLIASLGSSLNSIIYSYGILCGLGIGFCLTPAPVLASRYFDQKRATANSLIFTGTGLGGLVMPTVVHLVIEHYGLHPSLMILSGITLHTVVFASLYRPVQYYAHSGVEENDAAQAQSPVLPPSLVHRQVSKTHRPLESITENVEKIYCSNEDPRVRSSSLMNVNQNGEACMTRWLSHQAALPVDPDDPPQRYLSTMNLAAASLSYQDLPSVLQPPTVVQPVKFSIFDVFKSACVRTDSKGNKIQLFDVHLLLDPAFIMLTAANMMGFIGHHLTMILPPHCVETLGFSKSRTATLMSMIGVADTLGRLWTGVISDRTGFNRVRVALAGTYILVLGVTVAAIPNVTQYWAVVSLNMVAQFCFGAFCAIGTVVIMDVVGIHKMSNAWGLSLFCEGISICTTPLLIGYLRDTTGDYVSSFYMLATSFLLSATMFYSLQFKYMNDKMRHKKKEFIVANVQSVAKQDLEEVNK